MNAARRNMIMLALNALEGGNQSFVTMTSELRALAFAVIRTEVLADESEQAKREMDVARSSDGYDLDERTDFVTHIMGTTQGRPNISVRTLREYFPVVALLATRMCTSCDGTGRDFKHRDQCSCVVNYTR